MLRPRIAVTESSSLWLRVLPNDVDLVHVTNDRYLAYMDLGRNDLVVRLGLMSAVKRLGAYPVVRTVTIRYRRAARIFQRMELKTKVVCWNDEAAWFQQEFFVAGRSISLAYCKAEMRTKAGAVAIKRLLELAGHGVVVSPEAPDIVKAFEANEANLRQAQQEHDLGASP